VFDVNLILCRELESIRARTAQWTSAEKKLPWRLLDARRIAKELEGVMEKIHKANELLIVRSLRQQNDTTPLICYQVETVLSTERKAEDIHKGVKVIGKAMADATVS
jgi:hypothetical protein